MLRSHSLLLIAVLAACAVPVAAQEHHMTSDEKCTICAPQLSLDGAALWRKRDQLPTSSSDRTAVLMRAEVTAALFIPRVGIFSTMEFTPSDGPSPTITGGLQVWLWPRSGRFNVTGGLGFVDSRQGVGESSPGAYVARGWGQIGLRYRSPLHELSLFAQAGAPFSGSRAVSYQIGLSHPLAPYTFHAGF